MLVIRAEQWAALDRALDEGFVKRPAAHPHDNYGRGDSISADESLTAERTPDVPFVPTKDVVLDEMLRLAEIRLGDVLYDLGCGDGRIVITAAERFGIRAVGVDIDPQRIRQAGENAQRAGVTDDVRFIEGDLFDAQIGEATVVTLYLLPEVNLRLLPKLLRELRPGTRIVSHNYDMGEWRPRLTSNVAVDEVPHSVYFWIKE